MLYYKKFYEVIIVTEHEETLQRFYHQKDGSVGNKKLYAILKEEWLKWYSMLRIEWYYALRHSGIETYGFSYIIFATKTREANITWTKFKYHCEAI